jgi:hypothetical protein
MKMKSIIATAAIALTTIASSQAEVLTYQGSTRWAATLFTPNVRTVAATTSYTTYYLVETSGGSILNALRIDAWTTRTGRYYSVDESFYIEYGFFGLGGVNVAGGMESDNLSTVLPFRGNHRFGKLDSFTLYPAVDYYTRNGNLDITSITGSARINAYFSGNFSLNTAANSVLDYLEARGFYEY